jgi:hypothetical protein
MFSLCHLIMSVQLASMLKGINCGCLNTEMRHQAGQIMQGASAVLSLLRMPEELGMNLAPPLSLVHRAKDLAPREQRHWPSERQGFL